MFLLVIRKIINNKWMAICLLIGSILAVAMLSSIPVYTNGVLQKMLMHDLEEYHKSTKSYPGGYYVDMSLYLNNTAGVEYKQNIFKELDKKINSFTKDIKLPSITVLKEIKSSFIPLKPDGVDTVIGGRSRSVQITALSDIKDHIRIIHGRMCSEQKAGDVYEVIVNEESMKNLDLIMDKTYIATNTSVPDKVNNTFKVKVVGIFTLNDIKDIYWYKGLETYDYSVFVDYGLLEKNNFSGSGLNITSGKWYYTYDYHKVTLQNFETLIKTFESHKGTFTKNSAVNKFEFRLVDTLTKYVDRKKQLESVLWILQMPVLILLIFYIFMVSGLIIDYERNELAVMKSRGASVFQVFVGYIAESGLFGLIALVIGPFLGILICKVMGSSNGFLEFVNRTALDISLGVKAYIYSFLAVFFFSLTMLVPVLLFSRTSIVQHKQKISRGKKGVFWKKYFLDVILLAICLYGISSYKSKQEILFLKGTNGSEAAIDPLLFIMSTLFILALGLVFLRIFPFVVRIIFWIGKGKWSPPLYASMIHVGRSNGQEQFIMLFIVFTLAVGIFSANSARTINGNNEDQIHFDTGADIVLKSQWKHTKTLQDVLSSIQGPPPDILQQKEIESKLDYFKYFEPSFETFKNLKGVETATKVLRKDGLKIYIMGQEQVDISVMGIIPNEFAKVTWYRNDLLPYHINQYLNLMSENRKAVLLSKALMEKYRLKGGELVSIQWGLNQFIQGTVYAGVDYWPTLKQKDSKANVKPMYIIMNLDYIQGHFSVEPYEVWLKKKADATSNEIYKDMEVKNIEIEYRKDAMEQVIEKKNDPMIQGMNGTLSLGFTVTITITIIGFLMYWIISIKRRALQFGILRAMGMSLKKIILMLLCEQGIISGTAIFVGILIGYYVSKVFVPLLNAANGNVVKSIPFKVMFSGADYIRLYSVVFFMLTIGFIVLGRIISKINISQALKLGED